MHNPQKISRFTGKTVFFLGIGGCGVSGLALMLQALGAKCSGSDQAPSGFTDRLGASGIEVLFDESEAVFPDSCDLIIVSAAIPPNHPQLLAAERRGIPVGRYAEALGWLQEERTGISIAGTHGKSTTAAMCAHILIQSGLDPSFIIGAHCPQIGGGSRTGAPVMNGLPSDHPYTGAPGLLLAEACEFNRSFHHHRPQIACINNIEEDHFDIYGSLDAILEAFREFVEVLPGASAGGKLFIAHEGAHRREITAGLDCEFTTFGFSPAADIQVVCDPRVHRVGLLQDGIWLTQWTNHLPGEHNAMNAAAAALLAHHVGAEWSQISAAMDGFRGLERRMQKLGTVPLQAGGSVTVYDDYGHHPTEIEKTLRALRSFERPRRVICVFQPHQHSRTRFLLEEFAQSFASADRVLVPHIYFVRDSEQEKQRISAEDLVHRLQERGVDAAYVDPFSAIVDELEANSQPGDLVVIMGAGPVWQVGHDYFNRLQEQHCADLSAESSGDIPMIEITRSTDQAEARP